MAKEIFSKGVNNYEIYLNLWGQNSNEEDIFIYNGENSFLKVEILNIGAIIKKFN